MHNEITDSSSGREGSPFNSIKDEVQASAQIVDTEEVLENPDKAMGWLPLCIQDEAGKWEISIIQKGWKNHLFTKTEAETGEAFVPFGGGCHTKIILFGSDPTHNQLPKSQAFVDWGMKMAEEFAMLMNNEVVPAFPKQDDSLESY